jgi:hypothetical protein
MLFFILRQSFAQVHTEQGCTGTSFSYVSPYYTYYRVPSYTCTRTYETSSNADVEALMSTYHWRASCGPVPGYSGQMLTIDYYYESACAESKRQTILAVQDTCQKSGDESYENVRCDAAAQTLSFTRYSASYVSGSQTTPPDNADCSQNSNRFRQYFKHPQPPEAYEINFNCKRYSYSNHKNFVRSPVYYKYTCEDGVPETTPIPSNSQSSAFSLKSGNHHVQVCRRSL